MGDEIGVSSAIKPELLKRIEKNIGNSDSLAFITDDVYLSSFEKIYSKWEIRYGDIF